MLYLARWLQQKPAVWLETTAPETRRSLKLWERAAGWSAAESGGGPDHQSLHSQAGSCKQHKSGKSHCWVTCKIAAHHFGNVHVFSQWAELWPVERGAVYGVDGATARPEWEDRRRSRCHTLAFGGRCSRRLGGEGASEQQATLRAHQEGVRVPGRQSQGGDTHGAAASSLWATQNYILHFAPTLQQFGNHLKMTENVLICCCFFCHKHTVMNPDTTGRQKKTLFL